MAVLLTVLERVAIEDGVEDLVDKEEGVKTAVFVGVFDSIDDGVDVFVAVGVFVGTLDLVEIIEKVAVFVPTELCVAVFV